MLLLILVMKISDSIWLDPARYLEGYFNALFELAFLELFHLNKGLICSELISCATFALNV